MVKDGTFREDLYYRLNVIAVHLTPLRERPDDIPLLVQDFLRKFSDRDPGSGIRRGDKPSGLSVPITVSQEAMRRLMAHAWPGNVRQLENAIERALALLGGRTQIELADLPPDLQPPEDGGATPSLDLPEKGIDLPSLVAQIEKDLIERALSRTAQNRGAAARLLGLKRTTLVEKLKRM
jgi:transcriptional regulator with PAS, ATPase and Fis domain